MRRAVAFGPFHFDLQTRELRNRGVPVQVRRQSLDVLAVLVEHAGALVTRDVLRNRLWPGADYGDFDSGLNSAVNRLRTALNDSGSDPRYIETVARSGYRFVHQLARVYPDRSQPLRLVVLPFENIGGDAADEYFCEGLAQELTHALARLSGLHVVARTSARALEGLSLDIREVGRRLDVSAVVEGSVQKSGDRLRITVQLIDAADGSHLWSGRFDRAGNDIFTIQDETAMGVVSALRIILLDDEPERLFKRHIHDAVAFDRYLKGRWLWAQRKPESVMAAIGCFEDLLRSGPASAPPFAALSECYCTAGFLGYLPPGASFPKAITAAESALALDDRLGEAHGAMGWVQWAYGWEWLEAERSFLRAEELNPSYAQVRLWHSFLLASLSRFDEALDQIDRAWRLDPLSPLMQCNVAAILHLARRHEAAIQRCLRTLEMDPDYVLGNFHLGRAYLAMGQYDRAIPVLQKAAPNFPLAMGALGSAWANVGRRDQALEILGQLKRMSEHRYVGPISFFSVYAGLRDKDAAIEQLTKAFDTREGVVPIFTVDPAIDSVREDPRVKALLRRLRMPRKARQHGAHS